MSLTNIEIAKAKTKAIEMAKEMNLKKIWREVFIEHCKDENIKYKELVSSSIIKIFTSIKNDNDNEILVKVAKAHSEAGDKKIMNVMPFAIFCVEQKIASVNQIKDAAWEGFNNLLEATCLARNIQTYLGIKVEEININDFLKFN